MKKFIFTITTGRSGTAFLYSLLKENIKDCEAYHEKIFGYDKFGVETPDISHLQTFNSKGNTTYIKKFWKRKFDIILKSDSKTYIETSHILAKAGLIENLEYLLPHGNVYLINLKRDVIKTLLSFYQRCDFRNIGNDWMWYLDYNYPKNITKFSTYEAMKMPDPSLWYYFEMQARAEYYKLLTKGERGIKIITVNLENLNKKEYAKQFFKKIGFQRKKILIPPPQNVSSSRMEIAKKTIRNIRKKVRDINPKEIASYFYNSGKRIG